MRQSSPDATRPPLESQSEAYTVASKAATDAALGISVMASSSSPTAADVVSRVVGDHDGAGEGSSEGGVVGNGDGFAEGEGVGGTLGALVGTGEGLGVGCTLGSWVGEQVTPEKQTPSQPRSELAMWPEVPPEQISHASTLQQTDVKKKRGIKKARYGHSMQRKRQLTRLRRCMCPCSQQTCSKPWHQSSTPGRKCRRTRLGSRCR